MTGAAKGKHSFFGARLFFVAPCTPENHVKAVVIQRLLQAFGFGDVSVQRRTMDEGVDVARRAFFIYVDAHVDAERRHQRVAKRAHGRKFPQAVHMQQRKRWQRRPERLQRQVQHHR